MKTWSLMMFGAVAASMLTSPVAYADETPEAISADCVFALDSCGSPLAVKTAADLVALRPVTYRIGETVTLVSPCGTETPLVSDAEVNGTLVLTLDAGGLWTVRNSRQGTALFSVRHSIYGTLGDGTEVSPARLVDGDELADLHAAGTASDGYVIALDGAEGHLAVLTVPSGFCLEERSGGIWCLVSSSDGCEYKGLAAFSYSVDSEQAGPNRTIGRKGGLPVAYSGDNWIGENAKSSTLTFILPSGDMTDMPLTGTGVVPFSFDNSGDWIVRLAMADGTVREARVSVTGGFSVVFR